MANLLDPFVEAPRHGVVPLSCRGQGDKFAVQEFLFTRLRWECKELFSRHLEAPAMRPSSKA